jgi:propanediol dehydratase small subunit
MAEEFEIHYKAFLIGGFIREAAEVYEKRGILKKE